ncbi:unnamed protein product [Rhizophagus irregularis]|nr:unnamed protein product [Rhizophagus irregularis]CAB5364371.1 unnamed protein product [Rhizophagus irregularis]
MNAPSTNQIQNVLKKRIEVLKNETSDLMEDIEGHIIDGNSNECLSNLGKLKDTLENTYEMVDRLSNCIDELERKVNEPEQEINNLKDEVNKTKFFSVYRVWIRTFMNEVITKIGGGEKWRLAENGLQYLSNNMVLTKEEKVCVENLKKLLEDKDIGMDIKDIKLLQEARERSNSMVHKNNQSLKEAEMKLREPIPNDIMIYKPPLKKALKAIKKWRPDS